MPIFGQTAVILNISMVVCTCTVGFLLCLFLKKSGRKDRLASSAFFMWICFSSFYLLVSLGSFFTWLGHLEIEKNIDWFIHAALQLSMAPTSYYVSFKLFQNKRLSKYITIVFLFIFLVFLAQFIKYGQIQSAIQNAPYGLHFTPHFNAEIIFLITAAIFLCAGFYDLSKRLYSRLINGRVFNTNKFLSTLSLVLLALTAGINQAGWITSIWLLIISRLFVFGVFLLAFFSFLNEEKHTVAPAAEEKLTV